MKILVQNLGSTSFKCKLAKWIIRNCFWQPAVWKISAHMEAVQSGMVTKATKRIVNAKPMPMQWPYA